MKLWKPKFYIVFPYSLTSQIEWPKEWGNTCVANMPAMLREVLKIKTIGSEIKLIWNYQHRQLILQKNCITNEQLDFYLKSDCSILSFLSIRTRKRAVKALKEMGGEGFICVDNYRDVIIQQAIYKQTGKFSDSPCACC